ncbi:carbohydrate sulfotransferase 11-like [Panulirus ornatus]|uniref:carbohydrate sulfotransferase 11-like n=1 Tax=Panulirus ornatus TaxID=150431 RepID=UPI003A847D92
MRSPRISEVFLLTLLFSCLSFPFLYTANTSYFSLIQRPKALLESLYNLSDSYSNAMGSERVSFGIPHFEVKDSGVTEGLGAEYTVHKKPWTRNLLPPGVSLEQFMTFLQRQLQGEEGLTVTIKQRLKKTCEQYQDVMATPSYATYRKLYQHLLYEPSHELVYCPVWKAMSTSWDAYLLQMAKDKPSNKNNLDINTKHYEMAGNIKRAAQARFKLPRNNVKARKAIQDSLCSVMIVRHPFQRLVSAYRDKMIARNSTVKDYLYLRSIIKHRYHTGVSEVTSFPTFKEFVDFVLDEWSSSDPRPGTWHEWSRDWHPAYYLCAPCHMNYTHLLRFEQYKSDMEEFRRECNLDDIMLEGTHYHQLGNTSSAQVEDKLYSQLSQTQVVQLAQMYFIDLVMFGYNLTRHFQLAQPD